MFSDSPPGIAHHCLYGWKWPLLVLSLWHVVSAPAQVSPCSIPSFLSSGPFEAGSNCVDIAAGDFNHDGFLDLVAANQQSFDISVFLGMGSGAFASEVTYAVGLFPQAVVTGDFNQDRRADIAVALSTSPGSLQILKANPDGTFQLPVSHAVGVNPISMVSADLNKDGALDLAVAHVGGVGILLGKGDGSFEDAFDIPAGDDPFDVVAADLNRDGWPDLAVVNQLSDVVAVLLNQGNALFANPVSYPVGAYPEALAAGDLDLDWQLDLAVVHGEGLSLLMGVGDGTFESPVDHPLDTFPVDVVVEDLTGDGWPEVVLADDNSLTVLPATGEGAFAALENYDAGSSTFAVVAGDFDGDWASDLAVANFNLSDQGVHVLVNACAGATPSVTIRRESTGLTLGWDVSLFGYALESASPSETLRWSQVLQAPGQHEGRWEVFLSKDPGAQFFRLRKP